MISLKSSFEGEIVKYYDLYFLPIEKVEEEVKYILSFVNEYLLDRCCVIDLGCGTGAYSEELAKYFDRVVGLDCSADMISYANGNHFNKKVDFVCGDARCKEMISSKKSSLVISLAHVIGYQLDNYSLDSYFKTVKENLVDGGLFFFNFYNQSAIYNMHLEPRHVKKHGDDGVELTRLSNAAIDADNNCLKLDYYYIVSKNDVVDAFEIHENMRYYSKLELEYYLNNNGFEIISFFNYNTTEELSGTCWNGGCLARKI